MAIDWTDKIRKLLQKAEGTSIDAERDTFLAKATELARDHAVDMHNLGVANPDRREPIGKRVYFRDDKHSSLIKARRELLFSMADLNRCRTVMYGRAYVEVVGHESDMDMVDLMYTSLLLQLQTAMARAEAGLGSGALRSWRTSYAHGWVHRVYSRLLQARRTNNTTPGTDLVLADRSALVQAYMTETYPKLRKGSSMGISTRDGSAYRQGAADANRADLGGARVGTRTGGPSIGG